MEPIEKSRTIRQWVEPPGFLDNRYFEIIGYFEITGYYEIPLRVMGILRDRLMKMVVIKLIINNN
jgi:hypothetical protein